MATALEIQLAALSYLAYDLSDSNKFNLPGWTLHPGLSRTNLSDGFAASVSSNGSDFVIAFRGTDKPKPQDFLQANIPAAFGYYSQQIADAIQVVSNVMAAHPGATIALTGHSLGGGLASVMAAYFGLPAVTFDMAPFARTALSEEVIAGTQQVPAHRIRSNLAQRYFDDYVLYQNTMGRAIHSGFQNYVSGLMATGPEVPYALYLQRQMDVTGYYLGGEFLVALRADLSSTTVSSLTPIHLGGTSLLDTMDLHSMSLLLASLISPTFVTASHQFSSLIESVLDDDLYAEDDKDKTRDETDFMNRLIQDHFNGGLIGGNTALDSFAQDVAKLGSSGSTRLADIDDGIIATIIEYYYFRSLSDTAPFVESIINGIQFDTSRMGTVDVGVNTLLDAVEDIVEPGSGDLARAKSEDATVWKIQSGGGALTTLGGDENEVQIGHLSQSNSLSGGGGDDLLIGGGVGDALHGGNNQDLLLGGSGIDWLYGDDGADDLFGGSDNDYLDGGAGRDRYILGRFDGVDTITGDDNDGVIVFDNIALGSNNAKNYGTDDNPSWKWTYNGRAFLYTLAGATATRSGNRINYANGTLTVRTAGASIVIVDNYSTGDLDLDLFRTTDDEEPPGGPGDDGAAAGSAATSAPLRIDPLVLDLDGDGIETVGITASNPILFDHDGDGIKTGTGWIKSDDAWLVLDRDSNGAIDSGRELFGVDTLKSNGQRAVDGFDALRDKDANQDSLINATDSVFANLRIWRDLNQDGVSQSDELTTLAQNNIVSIGLAATSTFTNVGNGNFQTARGTYTRGDGSNGSTGETIYQTGNLDLLSNTFYRSFTDTISLTEEAAALPGLRGSGMMRDLRQAASLSTDLSAWATEYAAQTTRQGQIDRLDGLMERWVNSSDMLSLRQQADALSSQGVTLTYSLAGLTAGTPAYNDFVRKLGVVERFMGFTYGGATGQASTTPLTASSGNVSVTLAFEQIANINLAYSHFQADIYESLVLSTRLNPLVDLFDDCFASETPDFSAFESEIASRITGNAQAGAIDLVEFVSAYGAIRLKDLGWNALAFMTTALSGIADATAFSEMLAAWTVRFAAAGEQNVTGTAQNDLLMATNGSGEVSGYGGNDVLIGKAGNDSLQGGDGNDVLDGGIGSDTLNGGSGNNVYLFGRGDGLDVIAPSFDSNATRINTLQFKTGVAPSDVVLQRQDSVLVVAIAGTGDSVRLNTFFELDDPASAYNGVQQFEFADGTIWDIAAIKAVTFAGTASNDVHRGTVGVDVMSGGLGNDDLTGLGGDDALSGNDGNDSLKGGDGNDVLDGGVGTDTLDGGSGNNVYRFGRGDGVDVIDTYIDSNPTRVSTLEFKVGVATSDILLQKDAQSDPYFGPYADLKITIVATGDSIRLKRFFYLDDPTNGYNGVQQFRFADGTVWDLAAINAATFAGTASDDVYVGTVGVDVMAGDLGNDNLSALRGNDILSGDEGNDVLNGGEGNNTYLFDRGDGADVIEYVNDNAVGKRNVLTFGPGVAPADIVARRNGPNLVLSIANTSDTVTAQFFFDGDDPTSHWNPLQEVRFSDGTIWNIDAILAQVFAGTAGDDVLVGTVRNDTITGGAGNDELEGRGGYNTLIGGSGDDELWAGLGDLLIGEDGDDWINGNVGNDTLLGGAGNDRLQGGSGNDTYQFGRLSGTDSIQEWGGSDTVRFDAGIAPSDVSLFRLNNDLIIVLDSSANQHTVKDHFGTNQYAENIRIESIAFDDGTSWDLNYINTHAITGIQNDQYGSAYVDNTFVIDHPNDGVSDIEQGGWWSPSESIDTAQAWAQWTLLPGLDNLYLMGPLNIGGSGNYLDNIVVGNVGNNFLAGSRGRDLIRGGLGSDRYIFNIGDGADLINNFSSDFVTTFDEIDWRGVDPNNVSFSRAGDTLVMTSASDVIGLYNYFAADSQAYRIDQMSFGYGAVWTATDLWSRVSGLAAPYSSGDDSLIGSILDDVLDGGTGADTMVGGIGHDTYIVDNPLDVVIENTDAYQRPIDGTINLIYRPANYIDTVKSSVSYTLAANVENLELIGSNALSAVGNEVNNRLIGNDSQNTLTGMSGNDSLFGFAGSDTLNGNEGSDRLDGGSGADAMIGGLGEDVYVVDDALDTVTENLNEGWDAVEASVSFALGNHIEVLRLVGTDSISGTGNDLNNDLYGNSGSNLLVGGAGTDRIDGGAGSDTMIGGIGSDGYMVDDVGDVVIEIAGEGDGDVINTFVSYTLAEGSGIENLSAVATNITIRGNSGDNYLYTQHSGTVMDGGAGNDTYRNYVVSDTTFKFGRGYGQDLIQGLGTIAFNSDTAPADVVVRRIGSDTWFGVAGTTDTLRAIYSYGPIGVRFSDGTTWTSADIDARASTFVNHAPTLGTPLVDRTVEPGVTSTFGIPTNTFVDSDVPDTFTFTATQASGSALPSWLSLNPYTGVFTASPAASYVGSINVLVTATDAGGVTVTDVFTLTASDPDLVLTGTDANDVLTGKSGNDTLDGGLGADQLSGKKGNDIYYVDNGGDVVTEVSGEGVDTVRASISYALGSNVENLVLMGAGNLSGTGNSSVNIITGNSGHNAISGGAGADQMIGGAGDDTYTVDDAGDAVAENTGEGTDTVTSSVAFILGNNVESLTLSGSSGIAGSGNALSNTINGANSAGANQLTGGAGDDTYVVGTGDTVVEAANEGTDLVQSSVTFSIASFSNVENLTLTGSGTINGTGNALSNIIIGNIGANVLHGGAGPDALIGGLGNDTYVIDNVGDVVTENANEGTDIVQSSITYAIGNNIETLTLTGSSNIDGTGNALANTLTGNSGNNTLDGGAGIDAMNGGSGNDIYIVDNASDTVTESSSTGGTDTIRSSLTWSIASTANVENLTLTGTGNFTATGNSLANVLTGNGGNNALNGGTGVDTMIGGAGDDTYTVDNTSEVVTEVLNEGIDLVQSSVTFTLGNEVENLTLTNTSTTVVTGTGNALANVLTGSSGSNTLVGNGGNDTLSAGSGGTDILRGGTGDDTYLITRTSGITITENASEGTDTVSSTVTVSSLAANVENVTLTGSTTGVNATGNTADNVLNGSTHSAANTLTGLAGNDTYIVGTGDTVVEAASAGIDTISTAASITTLAANVENIFLTGTSAINAAGSSGSNWLRGNTGNNTLTGNNGSDLLFGDAGTDTLTGNTSKELLIGGLGNDVLTTNTGADIIAFNKGDGADTVASSTTKDNVASIGGGALYSELFFEKSGNNLILRVSPTDTLTFTNFYASASNRSVNTLQVVIDGTSDYLPGGGNTTRDNRVERFNFDGLVTAFDAARTANPSLTTWALTNALSANIVGGSNTQALGGEAAYQYARNGHLNNLTVVQANAVITDANFGTGLQTFTSIAGPSGLMAGPSLETMSTSGEPKITTGFNVKLSPDDMPVDTIGLEDQTMPILFNPFDDIDGKYQPKVKAHLIGTTRSLIDELWLGETMLPQVERSLVTLTELLAMPSEAASLQGPGVFAHDISDADPTLALVRSSLTLAMTKFQQDPIGADLGGDLAFRLDQPNGFDGLISAPTALAPTDLSKAIHMAKRLGLTLS